MRERAANVKWQDNADGAAQSKPTKSDEKSYCRKARENGIFLHKTPVCSDAGKSLVFMNAGRVRL